MESSDFKIYISVESYDEKMTENYWKYYVAEKRIISELYNISIPNIDSINWRLKLKLC